MDYTAISFDLWMEIGLRRNFCGPVLCYTHDGMPMTEEEDQEFYDGSDPCIHIIRPYQSPEQKKEVEYNHAPSVWRNPLCDRG